ncbi:hypothetical protein ScPMuIL_012033 [Solemya velum]
MAMRTNESIPKTHADVETWAKQFFAAMNGPASSEIRYPNDAVGLGVMEFDSVRKWLDELRLATDSECMSVLQGKPLNKDSSIPTATSIKNSIETVRNESHLVSSEFSKLFKYVELERWTNVRPYTLQVSCHIRSLIHDCNKNIPEPPPYIIEQQEIVMGECAKLAQHVERTMTGVRDRAVQVQIVNQLTLLGQSFSRLIDLILGSLVQRIIDMLDDAHSSVILTSAIRTVIGLGLEGEDMCFILAREGAVRSLFDVCRADTLDFAHPLALRALATICCVTETLLEFEREAGVENITDLLCDRTTSEAVRGEAAGVIAQITSPCLDSCQQMAGFVENLDDLLKSLLDLCCRTKSSEIFLLATAAIANITFMDSEACECLLKLQAPRLLVHACSVKKTDSLFAKDQIATILANMAAVDSCRNNIIRSNGVEALLGFLYKRPSCYPSPAHMSACERVQQKAAIALSRLCRDSQSAHLIVQLKGIPRLVELCRDAKERNNSDAVLVASLAALRKICCLCDADVIGHLDYQQLIQPRLMDSFLMCSHSDENFV